MKRLRTLRRITRRGGVFASLVVVAGVSCAGDRVPGDSIERTTPLPPASSVFRGRYTVPVPPRLAAAATISVDAVEWTVVDGIATLRYALPAGFAGGLIELDMSGAISPGATTVSLRGNEGSATCSSAGSTISCSQTYAGTEALPVSMKVVDEIAVESYSGPVRDREDVATVMGAIATQTDPGGAEPIGVLAFGPGAESALRGSDGLKESAQM